MIEETIAYGITEEAVRHRTMLDIAIAEHEARKADAAELRVWREDQIREWRRIANAAHSITAALWMLLVLLTAAIGGWAGVFAYKALTGGW